MEDNPETVLIAVDTNLDTNLVVIPPRSATVGDVRERIKAGHKALYPKYGTINISAMKVEMFNRHYLLEDSHAVGQIFRGWQGCLHVELTGQSKETTAPRLESPIFNIVEEPPICHSKSIKQSSEGDDYQDVVRRKSSPKPCFTNRAQTGNCLLGCLGPRGSPIENRHTRDLSGAPEDSKYEGCDTNIIRDGLQEGALYSQGRADRDENVPTETAFDVVVVNPTSDIDLRKQSSAEQCAVDSNGLVVANKEAFGVIEASAPPSLGRLRGSGTHFIAESGLSGKRKRKTREISSVAAVQALPVDRTTIQNVPDQVEGSACKRIKSGNTHDAGPTKIHDHIVKIIPDDEEKNPNERNKTKPLKDLSNSSNESGFDTVSRLGEEGRRKKGTTSEVPDGTLLLKGRLSVGGSQRKVFENTELIRAGKLLTKVRLKDGNRQCSGSTTCESSGESESNVAEKMFHVSRLDAKHVCQAESSDERTSGNSSKSYRPEGSSGTKDVDEVVAKLVNLYSPLSTDTGGELSSDASEELQPKISRRRMILHGKGTADDLRDRRGRRGPRLVTALDSKFQHFIDSQNGLDELLGLTLSQRKSRSSSEMEQKTEQPHEANTAVVQRGAVAHDNLSIDVVPDTQVGVTICEAVTPRDVYTEEIRPGEGTLEGNIKIMGDTPVECGISLVGPSGKEEKPFSKSKSNFKHITLSADTTDVPSEMLKNFASIASESGRKGFDSIEDLLQPKSDDSQQFQAAVQLTRLSMAEEEEAQSDQIQSPKKSPNQKVKRKKKLKGKPDICVETHLTTPDNTKTSVLPAETGTWKADIPGENQQHIASIFEASYKATELSLLLNLEESMQEGAERALETVISLRTNGETQHALPEILAEKIPQESPEQKVGKEMTFQDEEGGVSHRKQSRLDLGSPEKFMEKSKSSSRTGGENSSRSAAKKDIELTTGKGRNKSYEEASLHNENEDCIVKKVLPDEGDRAGAERLYVPSTTRDITEHRPEVKSGRKKKAKQSAWPVDSSQMYRKLEMPKEKQMENLARNKSPEKSGVSKASLEVLEVEGEGRLVMSDKGVSSQDEMVSPDLINRPQKRLKKKLRLEDASELEIGDKSLTKVKFCLNSIPVASKLDNRVFESPPKGGSARYTSSKGEDRTIPTEVEEGSLLKSSGLVRKKKLSKRKNMESELPKTVATDDYAVTKDVSVDGGDRGEYIVTSDAEHVVLTSGTGCLRLPKSRLKVQEHLERMSVLAVEPTVLSSEGADGSRQGEQPEIVPSKRQSKSLKDMKRRTHVMKEDSSPLGENRAFRSSRPPSEEKLPAVSQETPEARFKPDESAGHNSGESEKKGSEAEAVAKPANQRLLFRGNEKSKKLRRTTKRTIEKTVHGALVDPHTSRNFSKDGEIAMHGVRSEGVLLDCTLEDNKKGTSKARKRKHLAQTLSGVEENSEIVVLRDHEVGPGGSDKNDFLTEYRGDDNTAVDGSRYNKATEYGIDSMQAKKRGKSKKNDVQKAVISGSPALGKSYTKTRNSKKRKTLTTSKLIGVSEPTTS